MRIEASHANSRAGKQQTRAGLDPLLSHMQISSLATSRVQVRQQSV